MEIDRTLLKDPKSQHYGNILLTIILLNYLFGVLFYPGKFSLTYHAFSHLGNIHSLDGEPNVASRIINIAGMIGCGWILFRLGLYHLLEKPVPNSLLYMLFSWMIGLGYLMMICPSDSPTLRLVHIIGSVLVVGGFVFLVATKTLAVRRAIKRSIFWLLVLGISAPVLLYAGFWFFKCPSNPLYQKFAIAALITGVFYTFRVSRIHGEGKILHG